MSRALRPRGAIPRATIGYYGERARPGCTLRYTVSGRGVFPRDMLRYDDARDPPTGLMDDGKREVRIHDAGGCTPERWRSFGWSVHDDIEEIRA